jgi:tetratricopeptide (TPR) repeat protein
MRGFLILLLLIPGIAFAATMEEIESHFQKGLQYSQQGRMDEAIEEFSTVVSADHSGFPQDYYVQTYSEAFFDIGVLYSKKGNMRMGIENLKKALEIFPDHKRALYYLSGDLLEIGEIADAKLFYSRAKDLGFSGDNPQIGDTIGNYFSSLREKELAVQYQSFFDSKKIIAVAVQGNPIGDEQLIRDTITAIEKQSKIIGYGYLTPILVERIRQKENNTIIIEKWTIGEGYNSKAFWIKYNSAPPVGFPYKVMILISEKDDFPAME